MKWAEDVAIILKQKYHEVALDDPMADGDDNSKVCPTYRIIQMMMSLVAEEKSGDDTDEMG